MFRKRLLSQRQYEHLPTQQQIHPFTGVFCWSTMGKLRGYIGDKHNKSVDDLSTDELVLFNFLALIVDIKYRLKYGRSLEHTDGKGYSKHMLNEDVPGQITSVENGLERVVQRGLPDAT